MNGKWTGAALLAIALANLAVIAPLFGIEYLDAWHSNETTFMTIAHFLVTEWPNVEWFPWWDLGMPFENTYLPAIPVALAILHKTTGASIPHLYHILEALAYCLGPVGLYLLCIQLRTNLFTALTAALAWSLCTFAAVLYPEIRTDLGGLDLSARIRAVAFYGEGPHQMAMALLPWSLLLAARAIGRPTSLRIALALAAAAITSLTNAFGAIAQAIAFAALLLALRPDVARWKRGAAIAASAAALYALIAGAVSPALLETIRFQSQYAGGHFPWTSSKIASVLLLAVAVIAAERLTRASSPASRFAILYLLFFAALPSGHYWFGVDLVPQAWRYHTEVDFGVALAFGLAAGAAVRLFPRARSVLAIVLLALAARQLIVFRSYAASEIRPSDPSGNNRLAVARWAQENLPDSRMMVSGDAGFPFNLFAGTLQTSSGHQPSTPNWQQAVGTFTIYSGMNAAARDADYSLLWLKAFGAKAVLVPGQRFFVNAAKFEGRLPVLAEFAGWKIYGTGYRRHSLFRVVPSSALVRDPPIHGLDVRQLEPFVAALDAAPPSLDVQRVHAGAYRVHGRFPPGAALSVAWNHDPGWTATVAGNPVPILRDGIGLIAIEPACAAPCTVELTFRPGNVRQFCRYLSLAAWLLLLAAAVLSGRIQRALAMEQ